ncbi:MAG: Gfo/Idh/MocA family oxidoreductase [Acidobacteria bacterium]|nr:Gfo/Idh/MocA family oxidoreductase [Acidobacteriota bacterium]
MHSRRNFLGNVATGLAAAAQPPRVLGANDKIRVGIIGPGARGMELVHQAIKSPNVEMAAFCDVYTARLEAGKKLVPTAKTYMDYRYMLDDKSIDAVLIATPQHLHREHFVASVEGGKHIYQEKTMAFSVDHAKAMRAAYDKNRKLTVAIGHQHVSSGMVEDARAWLKEGGMGKITAIVSDHWRNTPHGKPQWSRPVYPDMTSENILWNKFLGDAPKREFDPNRYINWRFFWDYSGGNVYENMCHTLSVWYKALDLQIPRQTTMVGGVYLWKDGREVPDTMTVTMEHPEDILFSFVSGFGNDRRGWGEDVLGTEGTITRANQIRYFPQKVNNAQGNEKLGLTKTNPNGHMLNFFESIRASKEPNCPFEIGFRISIACRMAVESYRQGRTMRWDAAKEEIV